MSAMGCVTKHRPEFNLQAYKLCLLGATDADLAGFFEVSVSTINRWKKQRNGFSDALRRGKAGADAEVANSLYQLARGFERTVEKPFVDSKGNSQVVAYRETLAPDYRALALWLKNRQPDKWRDKTVQETTGADGGPIEIVISGDAAKL